MMQTLFRMAPKLGMILHWPKFQLDFALWAKNVTWGWQIVQKLSIILLTGFTMSSIVPQMTRNFAMTQVAQNVFSLLKELITARAAN